MHRKFLSDIKRISPSILVLTVIFTSLLTCTSTHVSSNHDFDRETSETSAERISNTSNRSQTRTQEPLFTGTGGRGLVIAVPAPSLTGGRQTDNWMPQLFQDLITADLSRYSAMTVIDRQNEALALAEQQLSASGYYSDDDYIAMGRLTNANHIVAGNILGMSGRYSVSFRINNSETNEIQASFSKQYNTQDIESGLAAKEAVRELLTGMGVELTPEGERQLFTIQENFVRTNVRLAQGVAAERNNDYLDSLRYFLEALAADSQNLEASQRIQNFAQGSPGASIRERAEWSTTQKVKWEKIFNDLGNYMYDNLYIAVYDFSTISDEFNARTNRVTITLRPGVKMVPDSMVLTVWKTVNDEWRKISNLEENRQWANSLSVRYSGQDIIGDIRSHFNKPPFSANVDLYDEDGISIANTRSSQIANGNYHVGTFVGRVTYTRDLQILPQNRYFTATPFVTAIFRDVNIADVTDNLSAKVTSIFYDGRIRFPARIMSQSEWDAWVSR